ACLRVERLEAASPARPRWRGGTLAQGDSRERKRLVRVPSAISPAPCGTASRRPTSSRPRGMSRVWDRDRRAAVAPTLGAETALGWNRTLWPCAPPPSVYGDPRRGDHRSKGQYDHCELQPPGLPVQLLTEDGNHRYLAVEDSESGERLVR